MAMEVETQNDPIDAPGDEVVEMKSSPPDPALRRRRPRYKVECSGERPKEYVERLQQLYPCVDQEKTPLPLRWSYQDKAPALIITNNYRQVTYIDNGDPNQESNAKDAAAVRADHPIPVTCGVFYFEVTVMCSEAECCMGVGLCERNVDLNRLPGWDKASYGYHGDDGHFFCSSGSGQAYGPTFTTNDVIGCGIDFVRKSIFFTKNGRHLGVAIENVANVVDLYPMIGLQKHGAVTDTNFGQRPFKYDIEQEHKAAREHTFEQIRKVELPQAKTNWMDQAISSWLLHEGYDRALNAFKKHSDQNIDVTGEDVEMERGTEESPTLAVLRRELKSMVMSGGVRDAVDQVKNLYPELMQQNKELFLLMKCQQYVEIYARANRINIASVTSKSPKSPCCSPESTASASQRDDSRAAQSGLSASSGIESYAQVYSRKGHPYTICASSENVGTVNPFKRRIIEWEPVLSVTRRSRRGNEAPSEPHPFFRRWQASQRSAMRGAHSSDESMDGRSGSSHAPSSNGITHASNGSATTSNGTISETNGVTQPTITSATTIIDEDQDPSRGDTHEDVIGGAELVFPFFPGWTGGNPKDMMACDQMERLLSVGREINRLCQGLENPSATLIRRVNDTLALICHTKPLKTSLRYLLEFSQRVQAADALISSLRGYSGSPQESLLSINFRTARKLRNELIASRRGIGVFADIDKLVIQNLEF